MGEITEKTASRLREQGVKPAPKWQFMARDLFLWLAFAVAVLLGALAFSAMLFLIVDHDWTVHKMLGVGPASHMLMNLPYLWIVATVVLGLLAMYNFQKTKLAYRKGVVIIVASSVVASLGIGATMYAFGFGGAVDEIVAKRVSVYGKVVQRQEKVWSNPEEGLLTGEIIEIRKGAIFILSDFDDSKWIVTYERAEVEDGLIHEGIEVRMRGMMLSEDKFEASYIWPLHKAPTGPRGMFERKPPQARMMR